LTLNENVDVVGRLESEVRALEEAPVPNSQADFFEIVFRIKKQLSTVRADLWRLKGMLLTLADGGAGPDSFKDAEQGVVRTWANEADYLHETVENLRDGLLSIIELHLNLASFEMNKVMRILAVASVLGLVPAVVGGLFGMNIEGNPWPLTLPQITFLISIGMLLCLYIFLAKGWLR
jgi:Mg2+ and Co2+ transporter CorA